MLSYKFDVEIGSIENGDLGIVSNRLKNSLNESVLEGGKLARPELLFLVGRLLKLDKETLTPYARGAEWTHSAFLAHDDVIDKANTRRDRPTLNSLTSNSQAVLAGDYLLAEVVVSLAKLGNLEIITHLAQVIQRTVEAEWAQNESRGKFDMPRTLLDKVATQKTGALLGWCMSTPFRLFFANAGAHEVKSSVSQYWVHWATSFGEKLGYLFQCGDDLLDFETTSKKQFAKDLKEGLLNQVLLEMLEIQPSLRAIWKQGFVGEDWAVETKSWPIASAKQAVRQRMNQLARELTLALQELRSSNLDIEVSELDSLENLIQNWLERHI
jgi:all-trans-nonaprenyl-diphosphate synthase